MALFDTRYQHWGGRHRGIWWRRWVIAEAGLRGCLQNKWMRYVIAGSWGACLLEVAVLFCVGQLLVADSLIVRGLANVQGPAQALARGLTIWLEQNPDISVGVTQNLLFYHFSRSLLTLGLVGVTLAIPHLITRDRSSHAMVIYASKAVNRLDYLLGKCGVLAGVLLLTWVGPVLAAWLLGNLMAPSWHFFWHSRGALGRALAFAGAGTLFLSVLALGVSSISGKERATVGLWILLWLVGNALVPLSAETRPWLKHASFRYNLDQVSVAVFDLGNQLKLAQDNVPMFGDMLRQATHRTYAAWQQPDLRGPLAGLGTLLIGAGGLLWLRTKPE